MRLLASLVKFALYNFAARTGQLGAGLSTPDCVVSRRLGAAALCGLPETLEKRPHVSS